MAKLSREDALRFYKRYYAPNNAILVVAGDVTPEEVKQLAEQTYGKVPANPQVDVRHRPTEPPPIAERSLILKDARAGNASFHRYYTAPSYTTAKAGDAEALDLLMKILADGATSRLYQQARRRGQDRRHVRRRLLRLGSRWRGDLALCGRCQRHHARQDRNRGRFVCSMMCARTA